MLRFYLVIIFSIPLIAYYIIKAKYYYEHEELYDEVKCYKLANDIINSLKKRARIDTIAIDADKLPEEGGYIMYSNHQGKYDALGIMSVHEKPCSVVMDAERSKILLADQVVDLVRGKRLERNNMKQQMEELKSLTEEARAGKKFIYFPEGGYDHNGNKLQDFRAGAFKCAKNAQVPIVPVAIYDSHLPFDFNSLRKVTTQVCFLDPLYYEDYCDMNTQEIAKLVKQRIEEQMEVLEENRARNGFNTKFKIYQS